MKYRQTGLFWATTNQQINQIPNNKYIILSKIIKYIL